MATSAQQLEGLTLDSGWYVEKLLPRRADQTGGTFSSAYIISKPDGTQAFLKAMDFDQALKARDPASVLNQLTNAYLFEREILQLCGARRLSRVIRAIGDGKLVLPGPSAQPVQYLIFELAPQGDVRKHLSSLSNFDLKWRLECLHQVFVGVQQLHTNSIAHQDVKPSNILECGAAGHKLADLGRAWHRSTPAPHDHCSCAGDHAYAPPELLYSGATLTEEERRFGADFYLLGSMVVFMFSGMRSTAALMSSIAPDYRWKTWSGSYSEVLPYLEHGFANMLAILKQSITDNALQVEIEDLVQQMCNPDVAVRGDRRHKARVGSRFGLQRFISKLEVLKTQARTGKLKQ
jgi:eukaryotic-like serine/threonine-protein kinase